MKNNELFTVRPSLTQYYGRTVVAGLEFDEWTDDRSVHQVMKDGVLTTTIDRKWMEGNMENTLHSVQTEKLPEGTILIWNEQMGYIVPNVDMYKMADLEDEIREIKAIYIDNTDMNPVKEGGADG